VVLSAISLHKRKIGSPLKSQKFNALLDCVYYFHQCSHGWALDAEGRLRDVPAATSKGEWPRRSIVPVHHVEERGGFVWLFFGSKDLPADARPPIPYVSELDDASWKAVYGEIEFESNHSAVFDNATDVSHIHYVHSSSFGNQNKPEILDMTAEADEFGVTSKFKLYNKPSSVFWEWTKVPVVEVTATAFLPSTSVISFTLGAGKHAMRIEQLFTSTCSPRAGARTTFVPGEGY
jgi:phenylpropionate dioxygenase-like ring-hydroxylating dioxygenase large terminal subunit